MASRLPGEQDLGGAPQVSPGRGVMTYDVSPIAAGGQSIARATAALGSAIAGVGQAVAEVDQAGDRWELARAKAELLSGKNKLDLDYDGDSDYATLPNRYDKDIDGLQAKVSERITNPRVRELFIEQSAVQVSVGKEAVGKRARGLAANAETAWWEETAGRNMDAAVSSGDPEKQTEALRTYHEGVDGLVAKGYRTPMEGLAMKRAYAKRFATADVLSRIDRGEAGTALEDLRGSRGRSSSELQAPASVDPVSLNALPTGPAARDTRVQAAFGFFRAKGYSAVQASGIVGNLLGETAWLNTREVHDGGIGLGIAGWNGKRLAALRAFAAETGTEPTDFHTQLEFVDRELKGSESAVGRRLMAAQTPEQAGDAVLAYERPKNWDRPGAHPERARYARQVFDRFGSTAPPAARVAAADAGTATDAAPGAAPREPGIYDFLDPDVREGLILRAEAAEHRATVQRRTEFANGIKDDIAEADRTGGVTAPKSAEQFMQIFGEQDGAAAYREYRDAVQLGADKNKLATLGPDQTRELIDSYAPKPGEGYAEQAKRQDILVGAFERLRKERSADPGLYATTRLPVVSESWARFNETLSDPAATPDARAAAARQFAETTVAEQRRIGVAPEAVAILPKGYVDHFGRMLAKPQADGGSLNVAQAIEAEAKTWGEYWPQVYRQLSKSATAPVLVIGSGVRPLAAQVLTEFANTKLQDIANDQSDEKIATIRKDVRDAFRPLVASMVGNEGSQPVIDAFQSAGDKLAAYYVRSGKSSSDAAAQAFDDLLGHKYEFVPSRSGLFSPNWSSPGYRVPKSIEFTPEKIAAGVDAAREFLSDFPVGAPVGRFAGMVEPGNIDLDKRPRVRNEDGSISTVRSMSANFDGREVLVPTVSEDGRILSDDEAIAQYQATGKHLGKFDSPENADRFAQALHERQGKRYGGPLDIAPARDTIGGLSARYLIAETARTYARDGVWVTAPDESGLALIYQDRAVRRADGKPLVLSWTQLARLADERSNRIKREEIWAPRLETGEVQP